MGDKFISAIENLDVGKGADDKTIAEVEKTFNFKFPSDFLTFLKNTDGAEGPIGKNGYISLWSLKQMVVLNDEYFVNKYKPNLMLFGTDGGGEGFGYNKDDSSIVQIPLIGIGTDPYINISYSFTDFIENYEERIFTPI